MTSKNALDAFRKDIMTALPLIQTMLVDGVKLPEAARAGGVEAFWLLRQIRLINGALAATLAVNDPSAYPEDRAAAAADLAAIIR